MTLSNRIVFEEPPARTSRVSTTKTKNEKIAAKLRKHPGRWARIGSSDKRGSISSTAHQINSAKLHAYAPAGSFEAVLRTVGKEHRLYARYIGEHA
jgi:hypothetical protein